MKIKAKKINSFYRKLVGLIGASKPQAIYFETHFGIHTFFMRFPIDIVVLDSNNEVGVLKEALSPNRFLIWNPRFFKVLELPVGSIKEKKLKKGKSIHLILV